MNWPLRFILTSKSLFWCLMEDVWHYHKLNLSCSSLRSCQRESLELSWLYIIKTKELFITGFLSSRWWEKIHAGPFLLCMLVFIACLLKSSLLHFLLLIFHLRVLSYLSIHIRFFSTSGLKLTLRSVIRFNTLSTSHWKAHLRLETDSSFDVFVLRRWELLLLFLCMIIWSFLLWFF